MADVFRGLRNADNLQSRTAKEKNKASQTRMRHAWLRMRRTVRRRIDHLHKCLCAFLVRAFNGILTPEAESRRNFKLRERVPVRTDPPWYAS
mmetsp:Transcript_20267/g.64734  ORF Transcript_20267/g.64734 Transcript_20267/m.64734 type:complete len:92 (-) Transcript_20267:76-351(-)